MSSQAIVACRDIMLSIHRYLEPRDFISMRRTCKSLHMLSKMKILWIYAVQNLYHRHGLQNYVAQLSLEKMSLADLERLALSPSRFLDWMRRGHSKFIPKFENFEVLRPPRFVAVEFEFAFMVPGGRFLVTTSRSRAYDDGGETAACLWDLGYGKKHRMKRRPVAHVVFPPDFRTTGIAATSSSRVVLCGVFEDDTDEIEQQCARVYTVDIHDPSQGFQLEAQLDNPPGSSARMNFHVSGDYLFMKRGFGVPPSTRPGHQAAEVFIWNYRCDTVARLDPGIITFDWVSIYGDTLVTVQGDVQSSMMEIKTFDIPLRRRADFPDLNDLPRVTVTEKTSLRQEFDYKFEKMSDFSLVHSPIWAKSDEGTLPAVVVMDGEGNVRQLDGDGKDREVDDGSSWGLEVYAIGLDTAEDDDTQVGNAEGSRAQITRRIGTAASYTGQRRYIVDSHIDSPFQSLLGHTYGAYANNHLFFFSGHAIPELPLAAALTAVPISRRGLDAGEPLSCYTFYVNLEGDFNPEMIDLCTICPLTGRMAVIWLEYGKEVEEIRVIDLLDLPVPGSEE